MTDLLKSKPKMAIIINSKIEEILGFIQV